MARNILAERRAWDLAIISSLLVLLLLAGSAGAAELDDIVEDRYGRDNYYELTDTEDFVFVAMPHRASAILVEKESRYTECVGWYSVEDSEDRTEIFYDPSGQIGEEMELPSEVAFGLYIESKEGVFGSMESLNDDWNQHVRVFYVDRGGQAGCYVLGFEDLDGRGYTDFDYQDVVLELRGVCLMTEDVVYWGNYLRTQEDP